MNETPFSTALASAYLTAEGARIHVALVSWDSSDNAPVPVALLP